MKKEDLAKRIEIEQAWIDGKKIQFRPKSFSNARGVLHARTSTGEDFWSTMNEEDAIFNWDLYEYRIMPDDWEEKKEEGRINLDILNLNNRVYSLECRIKELEDILLQKVSNPLNPFPPIPKSWDTFVTAYGCPIAPYTSEDNEKGNIIM